MQTEAVQTVAAPASDDSERIAIIKAVIEEIRPALVRDGGDCQFVSVEGKQINVKLTGACVFCKLASATLEGIQARMIEKLGDFVRVVPVPMGFKIGH